MKKILFYVFLGCWLINIAVNGVANWINLILAGILISVLLKKDANGNYSSWRLILGIGIAACAILIKLGLMFNIIKF